MLTETDPKTLVDTVYKPLRDVANDFPLLSLGKRTQILQQLHDTILKYQLDIEEALKLDLGKPQFEAYLTEVGLVTGEIEFILKNLGKWMKPQKLKTPMIHWPAKSYVRAEPYGLALVIAPWNFPFQLQFAPIVGALAAGNCVLAKPSELTPNTSAICAKIIQEIDSPYLKVIEGGVPETSALLEQKFDYIFFTGSTRVGQIVMEKAAKHLTPVTLELGGKSPCIVWDDVDLELVGRRVAWGRFMNAGQTCVAPDYVLVKRGSKTALVEAIKKAIKEFYGDTPLTSPDFGKVVNKGHFQRLVSYLSQGEILCGGEYSEESLKLEPTLLAPQEDAPVMTEEIFGPILLVIEVDNYEDIKRWIAKNPQPLAMYLFTEDKELQEKLEGQVQAGGICHNDTIVHMSTSFLPFGGIGPSGMGAYHGDFSFKTFSHYKPVMHRKLALDVPLRYPPYKGKLDQAKKLLGWFGH